MESFSSEELRAVFEAAPDGILIVDEQGVIRDLNPESGRLFGYEPADLLGREVEVLVPEGSRDVHVGQREAFMRTPRARPMGVGMALRGRRKDGSTFPVEISLSPLETSRGRFVIATVRDMTERMQLRRLGNAALRAAEDERERIARELHDDMAQRLAAMLVRLHVARRAGEPERETLLDEMRNEIIGCAEGVRRIAQGLRPPVLDEVGVVAALESHLRGVGEDTPLRVEFDASGSVQDGCLARDSELALYRIVQEAVSNVLRHAEASRLRVTLRADTAGVTASIQDDGVGFSTETSSRSEGLGLLGMRERAYHVGGELSIESRPGGGTRVRVAIPSKQRDEPDD